MPDTINQNNVFINGIDGTKPVPNFAVHGAKALAFTPQIPSAKIDITILENGVPRRDPLTVKPIIYEAWALVLERAKHKVCNNYFHSLPSKKTLAQILAEGPIILHCLWPLRDEAPHAFDDLPEGLNYGRNIGIKPQLLADPDRKALACTLIHELAHVAGAPTNKADPDAKAAEASLKFCLCQDQFDPSVVGMIRIGRAGGGRPA